MSVELLVQKLRNLREENSKQPIKINLELAKEISDNFLDINKNYKIGMACNMLNPENEKFFSQIYFEDAVYQTLEYDSEIRG